MTGDALRRPNTFSRLATFLLLFISIPFQAESLPVSSFGEFRQVEAFQPRDETSCHCQWRYLKHYAAKGCSPVYRHLTTGDRACHCPVRFQCPQITVATDNATVCLVTGRQYRVGQEVATSNDCEVCHCQLDATTNRAGVSCLPVECPEALQPRLDPGCYLIYREGRCCPIGSRCENETEASEQSVCRHDGREYRLGQKISPPEDPCLVCLCSGNWTGPGGFGCRRHDCQLGRHQVRLSAGCLPIYHQATCCPIEYHCPKVTTPQLTSSALPTDKDLPASCLGPAVFGSCHEAFPRFHFNQRQRRCEEFLYSGCGGNSNRFVTRADCEDLCGNGRNQIPQRQKPAPEQCVFDRRAYSIGETLDIAHPTHCVTCRCGVPPDFTCVHQSCPHPPDEAACTAEYKPAACCPHYTCRTPQASPSSSSSSSSQQMRMRCLKSECGNGCRLDLQVPPGTCPGCICDQVAAESRSVRETPRCRAVGADCGDRAGCRPALSRDGCPECRCRSEPRGESCFPPECRCPVDMRCPVQDDCRMTNASSGQCPVCLCGQERSLRSSGADRLQCPSASKCPEGCQLSSAGLQGCPACRCGSQQGQQSSAKPCLPPLCLCGPPRCESGCHLDRRVPLGRCPGCVCESDVSSIDRGRPELESKPMKRQNNHGGGQQAPSRCPTPRCDPPCSLEEGRPAQRGECPTCLCRFDKRPDTPFTRSNGGPSEQQPGNGNDGRRETCPDLEDCACAVVTQPGRCPECSCRRKRPDSETVPCPSSPCEGVGCLAVVGSDGCAHCQCRMPEPSEPCPDAAREERNCRDPCQWLDTPRKGHACPKCFCPKDTGSLTLAGPRQKCLSNLSSRCDGSDCKLIPDPDGCPVCACSKGSKGGRATDGCRTSPCQAPCALEDPGAGGRCPVCVCPPGAFRT